MLPAPDLPGIVTAKKGFKIKGQHLFQRRNLGPHIFIRPEIADMIPQIKIA
jgi:hypothetical protein